MLTRFLAVFLLLASTAASAVNPPDLFFGDEPRVSLDGAAWRGGMFRPKVAAGYLLCADTPWADANPSPSPGGIAPQHVDPATGQSRFVFGDRKLNNSELLTTDFKQFTILPTSLKGFGTSQAGAVGTLACLTLNAQGARSSPTAGLFVNGFEVKPTLDCPKPTASGSCVHVSVASIDPSGASYVYTYFIDYQLPALRAKYVIRDGFDPRLFMDTTSWCLGSPGFQGCMSLMAGSRTVDVAVAGSAGGVVTGRVMVQRTTQIGVGPTQLGASATPIVIAALFPEAAAIELEPQLDDNTSVGTTTLEP